jgi:outer membrane protein OmpA-like peptidoglycan-associated protein
MLSSAKCTWLSIICLILGLADLYVINFNLAPKLMTEISHPPLPESFATRDKEPAVNNPLSPESVKPKPGPKAVSYKTTLFFKAMAYELDEAQKSSIDKLLEKCSDIRQHAIVAEGHADGTGAHRIDNDLISLKRAQAVADYLKSKGVLTEQIQVESYGASKPVDRNKNAKAWARNRRAVLKIF